MKITLSVYHLAVIGNYFENKSDFINVSLINHKFQQYLTFFHYNPIPITTETMNLFPNIQTQHHYTQNDIELPTNKHIVLYEIDPIQYHHIQQKQNEWICKNVVFHDPMINDVKMIPDGCNIVDGFISFNRTLEHLDFSNIKRIRNGFKMPLSITSIELSDHLIEIPNSCFIMCDRLKEINLKNVMKLGNETFSMCSSLTSLTISTRLTSIGKNCFGMCSSLQRIVLNGKLEIDTLMEYKIARIFELHNIKISRISICEDDMDVLQDHLPSNCVEIEDNCFNRKQIKEIDLSNVKYIGQNCFQHCHELSRIQISTELSHIGKSCFTDCSSLQCIYIKNNDEYHKDLPSFLREKIINGNQLYKGKKIYTIEDQHYYNNIIPSDVEIIDNQVFLRNDEIESLHLPNTITEIKSLSFQHLQHLTELILSTQLTSLPTNFLKNCQSIQSINLSSIQIISNGCFDNCICLKNVIFSSQLKSISFKSFNYCPLEIIKIDENECGDKIDIPIRWEMAKVFKKNGIVCSKCILTEYDIHQQEDNEKKYDYGRKISQFNLLDFTCNDRGFNRWNTLNDNFEFDEDSDSYQSYEIEIEFKQKEIDLIIEEGIDIIDSNCFKSMKINTLTLPVTLKRINANAFYSCHIKTLVIPDQIHSSIVFEKGCFNCCEIDVSPIEMEEDWFENENEEQYILENFKNERFV